jgi:hypothetical protein
MKRPIVHLLIAFVLALSSQGLALADGGDVQLVERYGDVQISVFTAPTPLRAGPVDVSVLVLDAVTGEPVPDATIELILSPAGLSDTAMRATATREAATNKLMRSAIVELPAAGTWNMSVDVTTPTGELQARCRLVVGTSLPAWLTQWTWFTWPLVAVGVFGVHRYLAARVSRRPGGST